MYMLLIQLQSLVESRNQFIPAVTLSSLVRLGKSQERSRLFTLQGHTWCGHDCVVNAAHCDTTASQSIHKTGRNRYVSPHLLTCSVNG